MEENGAEDMLPEERNHVVALYKRVDHAVDEDVTTPRGRQSPRTVRVESLHPTNLPGKAGSHGKPAEWRGAVATTAIAATTATAATIACVAKHPVAGTASTTAAAARPTATIAASAAAIGVAVVAEVIPAAIMIGVGAGAVVCGATGRF